MKQVLAILIFLFIIIAIAVVGFAFLLPGIFSGVSLGGHGLWVSYDGGQNWQKQDTETGNAKTFAGSRIEDLFFDSQNSNIIYALTSSGIYRSTDNAGSWSLLTDQNKNLTTKTPVITFTIHPSNSQFMLASVMNGASGELLKSSDGGSSFDVIYNTPTSGTNIGAIWWDKNDAQRIIIGTSQGGILESADGGVSWSALKWFSSGIENIFSNPFYNNQYLVLLNNGQLWQTNDDGQNFSEMHVFPTQFTGLGSLFTSTKLYSLWFDAQNSSTLWAGTSKGLLRSVDNGNHWVAIPSLLPSQSSKIGAFAQNPSAAQEIYIGMGTHLYESKDAGLHWSELNTNANISIGLIKIAPQNPQNIFIGEGK